MITEKRCECDSSSCGHYGRCSNMASYAYLDKYFCQGCAEMLPLDAFVKKLEPEKK